LRIKQEYEKKSKNLKTLSEIKDKHFGKLGTKKRDKLEEGYENFRDCSIKCVLLTLKNEE